MITDNIYESLSDFTDVLIDHYNNDEYFAVVCSLTTAKAIFKDIMKWEDCDINLASINIEDEEIGGYFGEYLISFVDDNLFIDKLRFDDDRLPCVLADGEENLYFENKVADDIMELANDNLTIFEIKEDSDITEY